MVPAALLGTLLGIAPTPEPGAFPLEVRVHAAAALGEGGFFTQCDDCPTYPWGLLPQLEIGVVFRRDLLRLIITAHGAWVENRNSVGGWLGLRFGGGVDFRYWLIEASLAGAMRWARGHERFGFLRGPYDWSFNSAAFGPVLATGPRITPEVALVATGFLLLAEESLSAGLSGALWVEL